MLGATDKMTAGPAVTVKPFVSVTISAPVVTTTLLEPMLTVGLTVMLAVSEVALLNVTEFTAMPDPKLTPLEAVKWVYWPVMAISLVAPWASEFGLIPLSTGVAGFTVKALFREATSPPVVIAAVRTPATAAGSTVIDAVACVGSVTVSPLIVMLKPRLNDDVPCEK